MFRIRRIFDDVLPIDKDQIDQSLAILRSQFPLVKEEEVRKVADRIKRPHGHNLSALLFVAEGARTKKVLGFAYVLRDPDRDFFYLDYVAAPKGT